MRMRKAGARVLAIAAAATLALAACAELQWQKPGATGAAPSFDPADLSACRKLAQDRTQRMWGIAPQPTMDPRFGPGGPSQADLRLQESQAVNACMREKGYQLVPAGS